MVPYNIGGSKLNLVILWTDTFINWLCWWLRVCLPADREHWAKWDTSWSLENHCIQHLAQQQDKCYSNSFLACFLYRHDVCGNTITFHKTELQQNAIRNHPLTWIKKNGKRLNNNHTNINYMIALTAVLLLEGPVDLILLKSTNFILFFLQWSKLFKFLYVVHNMELFLCTSVPVCLHPDLGEAPPS